MAKLLTPFLPHIGAALAILGAIWWIDHQGYQRATRDAELRDAKLRSALQADLRAVEQGLTQKLAAIDAGTARTRAGIEATRNVVQPAIMREMTREIRFSDPAAGISDGLRAAIDRARAAVACTATPDGGIVCALPATPPAQGQ